MPVTPGALGAGHHPKPPMRTRLAILPALLAAAAIGAPAVAQVQSITLWTDANYGGVPFNFILPPAPGGLIQIPSIWNDGVTSMQWNLQPGTVLYRLRLRGTGLVALGNALAGAGGAPELSVRTTFQAPTLFTLDLRQGASTTAGLHTIGFQQALVSFAGGLLVPTPDLLVAFATDAAGEAQLPLTWPSFLPPGFEVYAQSWLADPSGPQQLTASNAWKLTRL